MREAEAGSPMSRESSRQLVGQNDSIRNDGTPSSTIHFLEHASGDSEDSIRHAQELVTFSSGQTEQSQEYSSNIHSTSSEPSTSATSPLPNPDGVTDSTHVLVESNDTGPNGISIFKGLIERARRTVRGSADDIGWLQRDPQMPPVEDGTEKFLEILDNIRHGLHKLPNSMVYLLVPGLFSNHGPLYFVNTKMSFSKMGLACHIAKIHSEASVEKNAREIKEYIEEIYWGSKKRVLLLGHSKGGVDAAAALSLYWPDLKDKVAGLALAQSPYGGSPIASDILREGQLGDYVHLRKLMEILIWRLAIFRRLDLREEEGIFEETPTTKRTSCRLISYRSWHYSCSSCHIISCCSCRAALPISRRTCKSCSGNALGAAMAACAQLLQVRYGEKGDGLVTCRDAEVPGSIVVRPKRKLDHAWMVYSSLNDDPSEADASQVCEALLTLLVEVGQKKRHELAMKDE
ncbi:hypothetical protein Patl1_00151 [Pistacia atlantica]|uniref:Uncharacterized protein n=1 Tax=Pistacia atlantica TaxID=434234 RepID=A0ACC1CBT0_9ROSI|nr:hypothetical protein Patl1_00151 [Pistacia atlantica]